MFFKIGMILSLCYLTLLAQDTSGYSDTSTYPDTNSCPDTSGMEDSSNGSSNPDTSNLPDTSQYPDDSSGLKSIEYSDSCDTSDTSVSPDTTDTTEIPGSTDSYHQMEYSDTTDTSTVPDTSEYPDSTGSGGEYLNTYDEEVQSTDDTVITSTYIESDGSGGEFNAPSGMYLGVGVGVFYNLSEDNPSFQAVIGRMWGLGDYFAVNLLAEGATDFNNSWYVDGGLRLDLYPLPAYTALSPFFGVGAGIGWGTVSNEDREALGVNLNGTVGLRLLKDWPVGLTIEANVDWLLNKVVSDGNPVVLMGRVGITF
ncbi:MAG TPA: hypothetical protein VHO70_15185 [Chitinispirillaceae bacterium]|nr:hypothetical protein [Chitinispirillaceae bacterium]